MDSSFLSDSQEIHKALLPSIEKFKYGLSNVEIYSRPYIEPGGDFYWCKHFQYQSVYVLGDCTGHGFQGAMISMAIAAVIMQYFNALPPPSPGTALSEIYDSLKVLQEENNFIDAELGILYLDHRKKHIRFAGSGINMIYKEPSKSLMIGTKKQKFLKGGQEEFQAHTTLGDQILLYSDGIIDQFDAADKRRLGNSSFFQIVQSLPNQCTLADFSLAYHQFTGDTAPIDDQTLILMTC